MKRKQSIWIRFDSITLPFWLAVASSSSSFGADLALQFVGYWPGQGTGRIAGLAISDSHAFVAESESGLQVLDLSDRAHPKWVGGYGATAELHALSLHSDRIYLAAGTQGLLILDISDSANPRHLGSLQTTGRALDVAVSGQYAYVAEDTVGLQIIDISNPSAPRWVAEYEVAYSDASGTSTGAFGVTVVSNYACVAGGQPGLLVIDVSNPEAPHLAASYGSSSWEVEHNGTYVYSADAFGVEIIDVSTPANPKRVSGRPFGAEESTFPSFAVSGDLVVMEEGHLFDVSNPYEPRRVDFLRSELWGGKICPQPSQAAICTLLPSV